MRIVKTKQTKLCVDGSLLKEYVLDEPLDEAFIAYLRNFGEVELLTHMRQPFLAFAREHFITIKGIVGDDVVEVRYAKGMHDLVADYFHLLLSYYPRGRAGVEKVQRIEAAIQKKIDTRLE